MGYCLRLHYNVRCVSSSYIPAAYYSERQEILSKHTVAVMWCETDLCYCFNPDLNLLQFEMSALQRWLVAAEDTDNVTNLVKATLPHMSFVKGSEVFPYSLFNHILCQFSHVKRSKELTPIVIHEHCLST